MKTNEANSKKLNKKNITIIAIIIFVILIILISSLIGKLSKEKVAGNVSISNMGLAVEGDGAVFYNKYEEGIIKVKGGKEYQITDETAYSMTVIDDTIYYLTVSDSNTIDIKSVKTNGDGLTKIKTIYTVTSKIYVKDNYIYYATNKDSSGIVKINLENGEETKVTLANIQDFVLDEDTLFFIDNVNDLYSVTTSGTDLKKIENDANMKKMQIWGKWIYFYDSEENALCKIKKDGSDKEVVATFVNNETYNVTSKYVYYYDSVNMQICRCDLKGKKSRVVVSLKSPKPKINVVDDTLYYLDESKDEKQIHQMYRVKTNGNNAKTIDY